MSITVLEDGCSLKDLVCTFQYLVADLLPDELKKEYINQSPEDILERMARYEKELAEMESKPLPLLLEEEVKRFNAMKNRPLSKWDQDVKDKCENMLLQIEHWNPITPEGKYIKTRIHEHTKDVLDYNIHQLFNIPNEITEDIALAKIENRKKEIKSSIASLKEKYPIVVEYNRLNQIHLDELAKDIELL